MHLTGTFLELLALLLLLPLLFWGLSRVTDYNSPESWRTFLAFIIPAAVSLGLGLFMRSYFKNTGLDLTSSLSVSRRLPAPAWTPAGDTPPAAASWW